MENKNKYIETVGSISKKETLASLEEEFCNGILAIESKFPFPGYYHATIPEKDDMNPRSVFLITKKVHNEEDITRLNHKVKKSFRKRFDSTVGEVELFNEIRPCIRIKSIESFEYIPELVKLYEAAGIRFLKYRKVKPYYGLIKIRKYFVLESPEPGFYKDVENEQFCYLQIPALLKWAEFEKLTVRLKRNMEDNKWDAAIGTIYRKNCLLDIIRIFDDHIDKDKVMQIKAKYLDAVKNLNK